MTIDSYLLLAAGALLGSTVSGISGVGGGMVYLPFLTYGVGVRKAVPYLTMLLLVSNVSRAWLSHRHIDWKVYRNLALGAIPGAALGALFYTQLSAAWISRALGVYLLAFAALSFAKLHWPRTATMASMRGVGAVAGVVSAVVGGSGPVVVPWFLRYGLIKESFLGTEAIGAATIHVVKIAMWGGAGMISQQDVIRLLPLAVLMIVGSYLGKVLVARMNVHVFRTVLLSVLALVGIRFLFFTSP